MDKRYQDIHFEGNDDVKYLLSQLMIERIDFTNDFIVIVAKDDVNRSILMPLPKLRGYKLVID